MGEDQAEYITDALEMMGKGYASIEIEQAQTVISRRAGRMVAEDRPAFVKVSTAFKQELSVISGDALKVWLFIALSINRNTGKANPGLRTIAEAVNIAVNTVQKALKELESMGLLTVDRESKRYNIYETPEYVSANKAEPTVSNGDTPPQSVSNESQTVSNSERTVSPSVILNQSNQNKPDLLDFEIQRAKEAAVITMACNAFELTLGFGALNWDTRPEWRKFCKWVVAEYNRDIFSFQAYKDWRDGEGRYKGAMTNTAIRRDPQMFMDTGWPSFLASVSMYGNQGAVPVTYNAEGMPESW